MRPELFDASFDPDSDEAVGRWISAEFADNCEENTHGQLHCAALEIVDVAANMIGLKSDDEQVLAFIEALRAKADTLELELSAAIRNDVRIRARRAA